MFLYGFGVAFIGLLIVLFCNLYIHFTTDTLVFDDVEAIPYNDVGLVLGTSKIGPSGYLNRYFKHRINAAVELYKAGKIKYILVSGDNRVKGYNEPEDMRDDLIQKGVPAKRIYLDYAGFRTLDSVVRCKEIFDQKKATVVSQEFHNRRAIFIGNKRDIDMVGYNARNVSRRSGLKTTLREYLAKTFVFLDLYLLNRQPKFLGEKIIIGKDDIVRSQ